MNGTVVEVKPDVVVVDMNHPLAGADLTFVGEVIESRPATNEEIQEIVNMMAAAVAAAAVVTVAATAVTMNAAKAADATNK